jgi:energy-coupling factor transporter ATP-binding protein EcfA2
VRELEPVIHNVSVKNFKSLRNSGTLNLKPITLLVGPNSSGKTALLQSILLLKQTIESRNIETPLVLRGRYVDLSSFRDVIFRHNIEDNIEISLGFSRLAPHRIIAPRIIYERNQAYRDSIWLLKFRVGYEEKSGRLVQRCMEFSIRPKTEGFEKSVMFDDEKIVVKEGEKAVFELEKPREVVRRNFLYIPMAPFPPLTFYLNRIESIKKELEELGKAKPERLQDKELERKIEFLQKEKKFFEARIKRFGKMSIEQAKTFDALMHSLWNFSRHLQKLLVENTYYVGPLREYPQRYYIASGEYPRDVGLRGEHTAEVIYFSLSREYPRYEKLKYWMKEMNLAHDVRINPVAEGLYALSITDPYVKIEVSLADIGFGASQLLPILVEGIYADRGSVLLIEQPEIHLHPRLQAALMDFFIDIAKEGKQVIVETHSEHLILRLQRRIAESRLSHNDVALYYFESSEAGSKITPVELDKDGTIKTWPKGFFEEDFEESYSLLKALGKRQENVLSD